MTSMRRCLPLSILLAILLSASAAAQTPACNAGPASLCLNNQRFRVDVQWKDFENRTGNGQAVALTPDTGYFWFFNSNNIELVVKVLDGRGLNGHFWVFFGALTNVEYTLRVTDTQNGNIATYFNPSGRFASVGDTAALGRSGGALPRFVTTQERGISGASPTGGDTAKSTANCRPGETALCLNGGRFRVETSWKDFEGRTGTGKAVAITAETGYFWFFDSANVELIVKVLDARGLNQRFWVFYGALSNVEYEMTVTDTLTGNVNVYSNPSGRFASVGDTRGFVAGSAVSPQLDTARAVTGKIAATGGALSVTGADGTVYNLTIPRDALLSEESITMTPVASIGGLPLSGGLVAGVDLAPSGLRLFNLATLTITPATPVAMADEVTFAWRGGGEEFFLFPPWAESTPLVMKVMHFGGYGTGRGSAADEAAQQQRIPASQEDALSQRMYDLLAARRRARWMGPLIWGAPDPDFAVRMEQLLRDHYSTVLAPELEIAKRDCKRAKSTMPKALSWSRQVALLGMEHVFPSEMQTIMDTLVAALVNCYDKSFETCVSKNDPAQVREMLSVARQLALLGADDRIDFGKVQRCASFELDFESLIDELEPHGTAFKWTHRTRALVPLQLSLGNGFAGTADLVYSVTYSGPGVSPCSQTTVGSNSVFHVFAMDVDLNSFEGDAAPPNALTLDYDPGSPSFLFTLTCPEAPPVMLPQERWRNEYFDNHHNDERSSGGGFQARDWARLGGSIYARRTWQISNAFAVETTIMNLKHTPK